jgi:hypothetical protein
MLLCIAGGPGARIFATIHRRKGMPSVATTGAAAAAVGGLHGSRLLLVKAAPHNYIQVGWAGIGIG